MPITDTIVMTSATTTEMAASVHVFGPPASQSPASVIIPIMISFQIRAMMKPNAAAIATAIALFISFMLTIFHLLTFVIRTKII